MYPLLQKLRDSQDLDQDEIHYAISCLIDETASHEDKAAFLMALADKGETPAEIAVFASKFLDLAVCPPVDREAVSKPLIDVCGTGGDKLGLFNISSASVFLLAGSGAAVVKHGNRGITSPSGGADVLEALGIRIELPQGDVARCLEKVGAVFLFAPNHHPAFKAVVPVRQALAAQGRRSVFNLLGPLLNPLRPEHQMIGVYDERLVAPFAEILGRLGRRRAWAVHGKTETGGGLDEVSTMGMTSVAFVEEGGTGQLTLNPTDYGIELATAEALRGGTAQENAALMVRLLEGDYRGPIRDIVVFNSAVSIYVAGLSPTIGQAVELAEKVLADRKALAVLRQWQEFK